MAAKREPRAVTIAEIELTFKLASYWWGDTWCPAIHRKGNDRYGIRVLSSVSVHGASRTVNYSYFELDADGVIDTAPLGYAKQFKPGQIADIQTWAERMSTPDPSAERITFGGGW
ncbi:hypothetical protein ACFQS1_19950 [Paractinoplanes rhizophilus]|uniref:Uncharacterized protein n=1 Tax=Paractinoplanes rhizophilus TaxID=1416877 RepID=A0ABW2HT32_9ACTN